MCHCDCWYVGRTAQRLQERIKQHVPKAIRQRAVLIQEQEAHQSQPTTGLPHPGKVLESPGFFFLSWKVLESP